MIERLQSLTVQDTPPKEPRVERIDSESATTALNAISAETAREIIAHLHEEPAPASEVAEAVDTSLANVNYHLGNLEAEGLVTEVDTWYSEKGTEMRVYAPAEDPIVFSGTDEETRSVRSLLGRAAAVVVVLGLVSVAVQWLVTAVLVPRTVGEGIRKAASAGTIESAAVSPVPAGLLFFSGGTFALAVMLSAWYVRRQR